MKNLKTTHEHACIAYESLTNHTCNLPVKCFNKLNLKKYLRLLILFKSECKCK